MQQQSQSQPRGNQPPGNDNRNQQQRGRPGGNRHGGGRSGSQQRRPFRPPSSIANEIVNYSSRRMSSISLAAIFLLAVFGGGLLSIAGVFAVQLATGTEGVWQQFALALGFASGFFLVLASNSVLFTEPNVVVPANLYNVSLMKGFLNLFLFWILAWIGNFVGVVLVVWLLKIAGVSLVNSASVMTILVENTLNPVTASVSVGIIPLVVSGILASWVMGITTMYSGYQRAALGKIACLFLAVSILFFAHLQFLPINMVILGLTSLANDPIGSWMTTIVTYLIPISVGNLIGGSFLVALPLVMQTVRRTQRSA